MSQDAIARLAENRQALRELLGQLVEPGDQDDTVRVALLERVERELDAHARIRQEVIQPALARGNGSGEAEPWIAACAQNYTLERMLLPDLMRTQPGTPEFAARVRTFSDMLEEHAAADAALFARVRSQLTPAELDEVDRRIDHPREP